MVRRRCRELHGTGTRRLCNCCSRRGTDVESKDRLGGQVPLSWATEKGHEAAVKLLLEKGAEKLLH